MRSGGHRRCTFCSRWRRRDQEEAKVAVPSNDEEDGDMDIDTHDVGSNGEFLPETLTQLGLISSSNERTAQLAAHHMQVDSTLGLAEITIRYPKRLSFLHVKDSYWLHIVCHHPLEAQKWVSPNDTR